MDEVIVNGMPDSLRRYITEECAISVTAFTIIPGEKSLDVSGRSIMRSLSEPSSTRRFRAKPPYLNEMLNHLEE